jgi:hypothetical protein
MKLTKSKIITTTCTFDRGEWIEEVSYGYCVYNTHPLAVVCENELFVGNRKISDYKADLLKGNIPIWYCLREWCASSKHWSFVCGLDLLENGKVWVGFNDGTFDTIEDAISFVDKEKGTTCGLFMEGEMQF